MLSSEDQQYLSELLKKVENGTATPDELHFVDTYFNYIDSVGKSKSPFADDEEKQELEAGMHARLLQEIRAEETPVIPLQRRSGKKWIAAAVILLALSAATYLLFNNNNKQKPDSIAATEATNPASHERAILKLANGEELLLDSLHGSIIQQQNLTVNNDSGRLQYNSKATAPENHTLYTPTGAQYELQLPDGSRVWLNAASSITYPTIFTGTNRDVSITGEAYFEVARNASQPFRVKANGMQIDVTGTHFNVNTYTNEPFLITTLLEGGVNVTLNSHRVTLKPGQQSFGNTDGDLSINNNVNAAEVMAWKNGYFHFESAALQTILREVARWYDLSIVYEGPVSNEKFFVIIKRNSSLQSVLKILEANNVQFSIDGKKLTVKAIQ